MNPKPNKKKNNSIFKRIGEIGKYFTLKKKETSYKKSLKKLENLDVPTTDVSNEFKKKAKEERDILKELKKNIRADIETEEERLKLLKNMQEITKKKQKEKIENRNEIEAKLKDQKEIMDTLTGLKIGVSTRPKDVEKFPKVSDYKLPNSKNKTVKKFNIPENFDESNMNSLIEELENKHPIPIISILKTHTFKPKRGGKTKTKKNIQK